MTITYNAGRLSIQSNGELNIIQKPFHILSHPQNENIVLIANVTNPQKGDEAMHLNFLNVSNIEATNRQQFINTLAMITSDTAADEAQEPTPEPEPEPITPVVKPTTVVKKKKNRNFLFYVVRIVLFLVWLYVLLYHTVFFRLMYLIP